MNTSPWSEEFLSPANGQRDLLVIDDEQYHHLLSLIEENNMLKNKVSVLENIFVEEFELKLTI